MAERGEEPGGGEPEDGKVLSPEELDITDSEHVTELEDGRYVVSSERVDAQPRTESAAEPRSKTDEPEAGVHAEGEATTGRSDRPGSAPNRSANAGGQSRDRESGAREEHADTRHELTRERLHDELAASFEESSARYGFDVTASFDGEIRQRRMASNDLVTVFESLLLWYAQQVDADTPVEEVLGILLAEANAPVRYPPESLHRLIKRSGLEPEDSIADLLRAIEDEGARL